MKNLTKYIFVTILIIATSACSTNQNVTQEKPKGKALIYYSHGTTHLVNKNYTEALDLLQKAYNVQSDNSKINTNLAMAYFFKGDTTKALKHLKIALEINPKNSDARNNLASIYFKQGDFNKALEQYKIIQKDLVYKSQFRVSYNIALIHFNNNQLHLAEKSLHESIGFKNDYCSAHFQLGVIRNKQQRYLDAYKSFLKASDGVCIQDPTPTFQQAEMLIKLKRYEEAITKYEFLSEKFSTTKHFAKAQMKIRYVQKLRSQVVQDKVKTTTTPNSKSKFNSVNF